MKRLATVAVFATVLVLSASAQSRAGEMKATLLIDGSNPRVPQTRFATYGQTKYRTIYAEAAGFRFLLPEREGVVQSGVYSYFALAGDCEVVVTYELLKLPQPKNGYGAGVGLALHIGAGSDRGDIQRVLRTSGESGFALHSSFGGPKGAKKDEDRFVEASAKWGRMGLRRVKNELIFLASEEAEELREIDRMPFTEQTIRAVRLFADAGGSPTVVDVRVRQIEAKAEEITGGAAERDTTASPWWWLLALLPLVAVGVLFWLWRTRWRRVEDEEEERPAIRKPPKRTSAFRPPK